MQQPTYRKIKLKSGETIDLPRVSHVLSEINKAEYIGKRVFYGNGSRAEIGTLADEMICNIINGRKYNKDEWNDTPDKVKNAVRAYLRWQMDTGFKPRFTHMLVYSLKHGYSGELDIGGLIKNFMVLVEVKTGELHPDLQLMQAVAYAFAYYEMYPRRRLSEIRLVQFNMDTGNFKDIPLTKDESKDVFNKFLSYKNRIIEWEGEYKRSDAITNQKELRQMTTQQTAVQPYQAGDRMNKEQVTAAIKRFFPKAPQIAVDQAIITCMASNLNPTQKHVYLIPFKDEWVVVFGIQGKRELAKQGGAYSYEDYTPRAMTTDEQVKVYGEPQLADWCAITILKYGGNKVYGYGKWPKGTQPYGTDKGNSGLNMAMIRSESNALNRLPNRAQLPPPDVQVVDEQFIESVQELPTDTPQPPSIVTSSPTEAIAESTPPSLSLDGKYGDMITTCWLHGEDWITDAKRAPYGPWHKAGEEFCKIQDRLKEVRETLIGKVGSDGTDLVELLKTQFGKPWSKLNHYEQVKALDMYYQQHKDAINQPEQAEMPME